MIDFGYLYKPSPAGARTCRVCGCWDERACPGGCYWVEEDLCSACQLNEERAAMERQILAEALAAYPDAGDER